MLKSTNSLDLASWIDANLSPNIYIVATLKPSLPGSEPGARIYGDEYLYGGAYAQFIKRFSKRIYGKRFWLKQKRIFPNAATLEGNGYGHALRVSSSNAFTPASKGPQSDRQVRYHLNIMMRRPDWMTFDDFKALFLEVWAEVSWAETDVFIEPRTGDCVGYSLKEGSKALLAASLSF